jgi:hypothetical protein
MVINNKYHILVDSKNVLGSLKSYNGTSTFIEIEKNARLKHFQRPIKKCEVDSPNK